MKPIEIPEDALVEPGPGRVLVRVSKSTEGRYGPLILPGFGEEKKFFGQIEATSGLYVEDGQDHSEPWLKPGDLVFFGKYSGTALQLNRDDFIVCREIDILAKVTPKPKLYLDG